MATDERSSPALDRVDNRPTSMVRPATARSGTAVFGEASGDGDAASPDSEHEVAHGKTMLPSSGAPARAEAPRPPGDGGDPLVGAIIADRYRVFKRVGEGGMGAVYSGEHVTLRKRVALKFLHAEMSRLPEVVARFEREAIAAANLEHPNVVAAHDFGKTADGQFFLVMEFVEGGSLRDLLDREPRLSPARALHIGRHIGNALARAHRLQIVHRDLKPENVVLVERDGDADFAKVIDFGIAKVAAGRLAGGALTQAGMVFGTPDYMAPEQALGANVDHRADLYAFGVMLFEMFTGSRPFEADDVMILLGKHMTAAPPAASATAPPGALSPALDPVFARLLAKSPGERFQSVGEAIQALELAMGVTPQGVAGTPPLGITALAPTPIARPAEALGTSPSIVFGTAQSFPDLGSDLALEAPAVVAPEPARSPATETPAGAPPFRRAISTLITGYHELRKDRPRYRLVVGGTAAIAVVAVAVGLATHRAAPPPVVVAPHLAGNHARQPVVPPPGPLPAREREVPAMVPAVNAAPPPVADPVPLPPAAPSGPSAPVAEADGVSEDLDPGLASALADYRARPEVAPLAAARGSQLRPAIAAFEQTRARAPDDPLVAYLLGTLYAQDRRGQALAVERYGEALRLRPGFARDATLRRDVVRAYLSSARPMPAAAALLLGPLATHAGPALLDALMSTRAAGPRNRATAMLLEPAYNAYADDTVRALIALARGRSCEDKRGPVQQLGRVGDARALPYLRRIRTGAGCGILGLEACNSCLSGDLPAAINAITTRSR